MRLWVGTVMVFLYARRDLLPHLEPQVTGWFATREPFSFDLEHLEKPRKPRTSAVDHQPKGLGCDAVASNMLEMAPHFLNEKWGIMAGKACPQQPNKLV